MQQMFADQGNYVDIATYHADAANLPQRIEAYKWTQDLPPQNYDPAEHGGWEPLTFLLVKGDCHSRTRGGL